VADRDDYRVSLIDLANRIAAAGVSMADVRGREDEFLDRFRKAYHHLADTVERPSATRDKGAFKGTQQSPP
jgi:hypothetical protein